MKRIILHFSFFVLLFAMLGASSPAASAQESLTLQIDPPLIRISVAPGGTWKGSFKVVNTNTDTLNVAFSVADFERTDEGRGGVLLPSATNPERIKFSPSRWLSLSDTNLSVQKESSETFTVEITIPEDAEPGTHTAAIIVGDRSGTATEAGSAISTNVTSLLVITVLGDISEEGFIRELSTTNKTYSSADIGVLLRFENTGNIHLEPEGEIVIRNLWGRERGRIPLNSTTAFDMVLPEEVRAFSFIWRGGGSILDIGPYVAEATLRFGEDQVVTKSTRFWIVPLLPVASVVTSVLLFFLFLVLLVRTIITQTLARKALHESTLGAFPPNALQHMRQGGVIDLREAAGNKQADSPVAKREKFSQKKIIRTVTTVATGIGLVGSIMYLFVALSGGKDYSVELNLGDSKTPLILAADELLQLPEKEISGAEILRPEDVASPDEEVVEYEVAVQVLNGSGIAGLAGDVADRFRAAGFATVEAGNAESFDFERSRIQYLPGRGSLVESLVAEIGGDPIIEEAEDLPADVVVIVGRDAN